VINFSWHGASPPCWDLLTSVRLSLCSARSAGRPADQERPPDQRHPARRRVVPFSIPGGFGVASASTARRDARSLSRHARPGSDPQTDPARIRIIRRHGILCDVLCVVHDGNVRHPTRSTVSSGKSGPNTSDFFPWCSAARKPAGVSRFRCRPKLRRFPLRRFRRMDAQGCRAADGSDFR